MGLVPKQQSNGNKTVLLRISKRGDRYLRELLVHGGRAIVRVCNGKNDVRHQWVKKQKDIRGHVDDEEEERRFHQGQELSLKVEYMSAT